jgi:hypothetical protein
MKEWVRGLKEHLRTPQGGEVRRHGIIGGTVAALLSLFEALRPRPIETIWNLGLLVLLLAVVFFVGFGVIIVSEYWVQHKKPIPLDDVGTVEGHWVYGVRDVNGEDRRFNRGSIVRITSSGLGFYVKGSAYRRDELERPELLERKERLGTFEGKGSKGTRRTVYFYYEGNEYDERYNERSGYGVGYYNFWMHENEVKLRGVFTGTGLGEQGHSVSSREVLGYRIAIDDRQLEFDGKRERQLLLRHLQTLDRDPDEAQIHFRNAGVVDGWWADAVYEKRGRAWEVVEGSVMMFKTAAVSERFSVEGDTYLAGVLMQAADPTHVMPPHAFQGRGRRMEAVDGFYYEYGGTEGKPARGTGYYLFHKKLGERPTFDGAFLCAPGEPYRVVYGVKIDDNLDSKEQRSQLRKHLDDCQANMPGVIRAANAVQIGPKQANSTADG